MRDPSFLTATVVAAFAAAIAAFTPAAVRADAQFEDQTCPNVTPLGRRLNGIVDASKVLTDELTAAAQAMVDGYRECLRGYDADVYGERQAGGAQHTNAIPVGRIYARLALARALQRVAIYDTDGKKFDAAKTAYAEALKRLDEMQTIPTSTAMGDSPERRLLSRGSDLKKEIETTQAQLPGN